MALFFVLIFGVLVAGDLNIDKQKIQKEKIAKVIESKVGKKKPVISEIKPNLKELKPVKEEVKPEPVKEEVKNVENSEQGLGWLKIFLYILSPILIIIAIKNIYTRLRSNSNPNSSANYMRREFKEETPSDTAEQQPAEEQTPSDTAEQQPAEEEDENNKK